MHNEKSEVILLFFGIRIFSPIFENLLMPKTQVCAFFLFQFLLVCGPVHGNHIQSWTVANEVFKTMMWVYSLCEKSSTKMINNSIARLYLLSA